MMTTTEVASADTIGRLIAACDLLSSIYVAVRLDAQGIPSPDDLHEWVEDLADWCEAIREVLATQPKTCTGHR